ncbi:hypothetical protein [Methanocorpusculum vombati]|uniref:DUF5050 domain-containing protein n=1 Tax=Methanocorpusculum vombati TaxID=3002864 RepID=A0ABT4IIY4_9EURY|nr:hypothetical protein [Methanocorpusculum vombati]MCZ9319115.1 hypothetical protein [Methanocorpusculum sp.]MCZ0861697.1 hypothetical protein [Methanocorpusculum vombati]MDE2520142.1 hypothetical protein [Methanocorpusculum sp.]MDE2535069.1 hypothetical protein [Methanocorpusculum sp.]MDE2545620.1 hypothetical protein [Methanocorpusculum sp.]
MSCSKNSRMVKQVFLFLLLITILCTASAAAVPITIVGGPEIIYEFQEGYYFNTVVTDGNYVLIAERKPNDAQKTGRPVEGYRWLGSLYLYDIERGVLEEIPGEIPSEWAVLENGTVYWIDGSYGKKVTAPDGLAYLEYTTHYYQYTPGDPAPVEIPIPQNCHLTRFATDGVHLAMIRSEVLREGVLERTLTLFDLRNGEWERLPLRNQPDAYYFGVSGDYLVYTDDGRDRPVPTDRYIHVYTISSKETYDLERPDGYVQSIDCIWGETLLYNQVPIKGDTDGNYRGEQYLINLRTKETEQVTFSEDLSPLNMYPPYAAFWKKDESTGRLVAQLATLDMPLIMRSTTPPMMEEPLSPQTTQAGTPLGMTLGLIAFVLACVLAVLWRKK